MFKKNDIVVRIGNEKDSHYNIGELGKVTELDRCIKNTRIEIQFCKDGMLIPLIENIRLATPLEIIAYNQGITNINDIKDMNYEIY